MQAKVLFVISYFRKFILFYQDMCYDTFICLLLRIIMANIALLYKQISTENNNRKIDVRINTDYKYQSSRRKSNNWMHHRNCLKLIDVCKENICRTIVCFCEVCVILNLIIRNVKFKNMIVTKLLFNALRKLLGNTIRSKFEINAFIGRHDTIKLFRDHIVKAIMQNILINGKFFAYEKR